jgi:hypothetical protein
MRAGGSSGRRARRDGEAMDREPDLIEIRSELNVTTKHKGYMTPADAVRWCLWLADYDVELACQIAHRMFIDGERVAQAIRKAPRAVKPKA